MKNKLSDLNDHLFAQLERLGDEKLTPEQIETEALRGKAVVAVADQILRHASLQIQAAKLVANHGSKVAPLMPAIGPTTKDPALLALASEKRTPAS
ncbi:MAG: hypothetical protein Q7T73_02660 [Beijerinckiaceae bacterium]|nr:hypothetical protein [Beijerinckiaceae bacterium]